MNILIVGEFSGFSKHLKNGFVKLGHKVTIVHSGDGWKNIKGDKEDISYSSVLHIGKYVIPGSGKLKALYSRKQIVSQINKRFPEEIDLIIVVSYRFISSNIFQAGVPVSFIKESIKKGAKLVMSICGTDPAGRYATPDYYTLINSKIPLKDRRYDFLIENSNVIIPTIFEYYNAIKQYCSMRGFTDAKIVNSIPLPISLEPNYNIIPCKDRKIVIFHGIIRPIAKGSPFIKEAMDRIQKEFPESVECFCVGGLPYDEYIRLFDRVDVLIDQTYCNGWGVNAIIGAMKGKCVLTSCGPENGDNMKIPEIPFVKIEPNSKQIYEILKALIQNPERIDKIKMDSRCFVEQYCASDIVARRYIQEANLC